MILNIRLLVFRIKWFTTMVGKKSSLVRILMFLSSIYHMYPQIAPKLVRTTQFIQGASTRWGIAWTFESCNLAETDQPIRFVSMVVSMKNVSDYTCD